MTSPHRISPELSERVLGTHPLPVADALAAMLAAESAFELRDRVVEVFRAQIRVLAAIVLSARLQFGPGKGGDAAQVPDLLRGLRSRGLTDGQWVALIRDALKPWSGSSSGEGHPLPELVALMHARKAELPRLIDELLVMRKSETVAHGATGTRAALEEILDRRVPQLARTLELLDPLWAKARLCVPLAPPEGEGAVQSAWLLMGSTPHRGRFRRVDLRGPLTMPPKETVLVDRDGLPLVALHPIVLFTRPSPDTTEELFLLDGGTKRGAMYVAFPSMSEHRETSAWSALESVLSSDEPPHAEAVHGGSERPYRGLSSFGPEDASLFFGREDQAQSMANRIRRHGLLTVTGPSGSGKTSLLRAGVLPLFSELITTFLRPGSDPLSSLASKLGETIGMARDRLRALAAGEPHALASAAAGHAHLAGKLHVVIVDQAEELLTLCASQEAREQFGRALAALASEDAPTRVVLSVREDFFGRVATVPSLRDLYSRHVEVITTPDRMALIRTLIAPAQAFGYAFEEEELVTSMVDAVSETPAALALLQFCADRLWDQRDRKWKRLTSEAYLALGGVAGALASHADRITAAMSAPERATCRALFLRLVSGERTRAVLTRAELLDGLRDRDEGARVLDTLIGARLVSVIDDAAGQPTVEIAHEALIKHWGALDRWLGEDEEGQRLAHALRQAAREWTSRERPRDLVWRGDLLDELRRYRRRTVDSLAGVEADFADASEAESQRGRRLRVGLITTALVLTSGFAVFAAWQWRTTEAARVEADEQRSATAREKVNVEIRGLVAEARGHEPKGRSGHALALFRAASALEHEQGATDSTALSMELERLSRSGAGGRVLAGHSSGVYRVCVPAGRDRVVTSSLDETTRVWERTTGRLLHTIPSQGHVVRGLSCSPDGELIATGTSDPRGEKGRLAIWEVETGRRVTEFPELPKPLTTVAFVGGGARLVAFGQDGVVRVFDAKTAELVRAVGDASGWIMDFDVTPDGEHFVTTDGTSVSHWSLGGPTPIRTYTPKERIAMIAMSDDGSRVAWPALEGGVVSLVDLGTGLTLREMKPAGTLGVAHIEFAPGSRVLVTSGPRGLNLWDARTGGGMWHLRTDPQNSRFMLSPDGGRIVTLRSTDSLELWDIETGARLTGFGGHEGDIQDLAFSKDGEVLVSAGYDRTARIYDAARTPLLHAWPAEEQRIRSFDASSDGRFVAIASQKGSVRVFAAAADGLSPPPLATVVSEVDPQEVAFAPGGGRVLAGFHGPIAKLVELPSGGEIAALDAGAKLTCLAFSPDGATIGIGTASGAVKLFDGDGAALHTLPGPEKSAVRMAFDPRGEHLAVAYIDRSVRILHTSTGEVVSKPGDTVGMASDLVFSPDGSSLAIADNERVRWLDASTWEVKELRGHEQAIVDVAFSPDGATLATASADQTILLNRRDGSSPRALVGHTGAVVEVSFSPDGLRLVSASDDATLRVWDVRLGVTLEIQDPIGGGVGGARFIDRDRIAAYGGSTLTILKSAPADRAQSLASTGALTNQRVCRQSFAVVPLAPLPEAESVWAPETACAGAAK